MSHLVLDITGIPAELNIDRVEPMEKLLRCVLEETSATVVGQLTHQFAPVGATVLFLLSESHASIHTYPEHRAVHIDYYHCGKDTRLRLHKARGVFEQYFRGNSSVFMLDR